MTRQTLLRYLPAYQYKEEILSDEQTIGEIVSEVLKSHKLFAADYDKIAPLFDRGSILTICERLFNFLQDNVEYKIENADKQTSRSPSGTLVIGSGDCKHYAGFIAGVLDSLKRHGKKIDWFYRFASYDLFSRSPKHVFVVVNLNGREVWIDPVLPGFDDRSLTPNYFIDKKVSTMALVRLSGFNSETVVRRSRVNPRPGQSCISGFLDDFLNDPPPPPPPSDSGGSGGLISTIQQGAASLANLLPDGGLKDWLTNFLKNPVGAILTFITGRTYTSGDYRLGETFLRNIVGNPDIQTRGQVPDSAVPAAWEFFTAALGVRIVSYDHMEQLAKSPSAYFAWMGPLAEGVSTAQAERANKILLSYGFPANQSDERRNLKWNLPGFAAIPYIFPLVGIAPGTLFSGTHPVTRQKFENGVPVSGSGLPGTPPKTQTAGFPLWLGIALGGGLLYGIMKKR